MSRTGGDAVPDRPDLALLADYDAGSLDPQRAAQVRAAAAADPGVAQVLHALAATRADLAALPPVPVPPALAARWAAAIDAAGEPERAGTRGSRQAEQTAGPPAAGRGGHIAPGPGGRRSGGSVGTSHGGRAEPARRAADGPRGRTGPGGPAGAGRRRPRPALVTAGLLAAMVLAGIAWGGAGGEPLPSLNRVDLAATGRAAVGVGEAGPLADPARRAGCLRAVATAGLDPSAPLLGARQVVLDDTRATLLVLGTGRLGTVRLVVVDADCGPGGGRLLADTVTGG